MECWPTEIPVDLNTPQGHKVVTEKFVDAILTGKGELVAEGTEGIKGLSIGNAIMLSSFTKKMTDIPFNADEYESKLEEMIKNSRFVKTVSKDVETDMGASFSKG